MKKVLYGILALLVSCSAFPIFKSMAQSEVKSMASSYRNWDYGQTGERLTGFVHTLKKNATRPWTLERWTGFFHFADGKVSTLPNYDVFNIQKLYESDNFRKNNGFGLVFKSEAALDELFQAIYKPYKSVLETRQWEHLRKHFSSLAHDSSLTRGHVFYYEVEGAKFLRTFAAVRRLGFKLDASIQEEELEYEVKFNRVPFPKLTVKAVGNKMILNYEASNVGDGEIRISAVPKGGWFGEKECKIVEARPDGEGTYTPEKPIEMKAEQIAQQLGVAEDAEVEFIIDDGHGHTAIVPAKLSGGGRSVDFVPTDLTLINEFPPDRYQYELDFAVIQIDGKTAEKNTPTTTKVKVQRISFADNRNQAKEAIQQDIDTRKEQKRDVEDQVRDLESDIADEYRSKYPNYSYISSLRSRISGLREQINRLNRQIAHYEREKNKLLADEAKNRVLTTPLVIRLDGAKQSTAQTVTLGEKETKTYTFNWNLPHSGIVEGKVNPDQNDFNGFKEQTFDNNRRSTSIQIASHKTVTAVDKATAYVEGIVRTVNDEKNEQQVYKEKVYTSLQIPDKHLTRRAGFGFDYTVKSTYINEDPESTAVGSMDTRSYFKNQVENLSYRNQTWQSSEGNLHLSGLEVMLENLKTNGDRANQTKEWKLPIFYVEEYSGKMFTSPTHSQRNFADKLLHGGRKWYTHFNKPDGTYTFHSLVRDAGVNKLNTNVTGNIKIDGVILGSRNGNDDYVKRSVTPNNPFPAGVGWNWKGNVNLLTRLQKWYNEWVADPKDRPLQQYVKTFFVTPAKREEIRQYNKSMNDQYIIGKSVRDVVHIPKMRDR